MKKHLKIRKQGKFYSVYEEDALVLHAICGYKVSNGRVGFPIETIGKVCNMLDDAKVDYVVINKDREVDKKILPVNNYDKYLEIGKKDYDRIRNEEELFERIKTLDKDKLGLYRGDYT